jgi:hypothetical protein
MRGDLWNESESSELKRSYSGTSNKSGLFISESRFISSISGTLKWDYDHEGYFTGSFKNEHKATGAELTMENVVKRGCYIHQAQQMIGIVLNVGTQTIDAGQELKSYRSHDLV